MTAASVLGVTVTPEMVEAVRRIVTVPLEMGLDHVVVSRRAALEPSLAPILAEADKQASAARLSYVATMRKRARVVLCVLGTCCASCGWPIEGEHIIGPKGQVHAGGCP